MILDTNKDSININKLVYEKEEMLFIEGDMIVPDSKPDILSAISTSGNICIYKKEIMDEKIKIDGNINTYVMYIADNSQDIVRGLNVNLDFSKMLEAPNCNEDMILNATTEIVNIECNVINGRKINIKAGIKVKYRIYTNEEIEIINGISENDHIQILKNSKKVSTLVGFGKTKAYAKDTIIIENTDNLAEILKININMIDRDIKTSYNKVLAKTDIEIKIMYLTEDNRIVTCSNKIPVVGFIDIQNVSDDNVCDTSFEMKNMLIKPNSVEEHSIYVELEVEAFCMVYQEKQIELLQDLYSPLQEIRYERKDVKTVTSKFNRTEHCNIKETINLPELIDGKLIDTDCLPKISNINILKNKITYEGELEIDFIYSVSESEIKKRTEFIPFEYEINNVENGEDIDVNTFAEIGIQNFIVKSGGEIVADVDLIINANIQNNEKLSIIDNIELTDDRGIEDYSLIIYIVKEGDTLWNIAKKYRSTVDDIVRANGIENENLIRPGEKLYIPKYKRIGLRDQPAESMMINYA